MYVCVCVCVYVCMYIRMYIYIYIRRMLTYAHIRLDRRYATRSPANVMIVPQAAGGAGVARGV